MPSFVPWQHISNARTALYQIRVQQWLASSNWNHRRHAFHVDRTWHIVRRRPLVIVDQLRYQQHHRSHIRFRPYNIFFSTTTTTDDSSTPEPPIASDPPNSLSSVEPTDFPSSAEPTDFSISSDPIPTPSTSSREEHIRPKAASYIEIEDNCDFFMDEDDVEYDIAPPPADNPITLTASIKSGTMASAIAQSMYSSQPYPDEEFLAVGPSVTQPTKYSIYDLDAASIRNITDIDAIADVIDQLEKMDSIEANDVGPLIMPLSRITSQKKHGERGAKLTERLLLTCLGRLPLNIFDRYTIRSTYTETVVPNKFSTVLATKEWIPNAVTTNDTDHGDASSRLQPGHDQSIIRIGSKLSYPPEDLFNRAIIAWGNLGNSVGLHQAESMFQLQVEEYVRELEFLRYHQIKNKQQKQILQANNNQSDLPFMGLNPELQLPPEPFAAPPGRKAYKSLIRAWAVSGEKNAAAKAYELMREMEHLSGVQELLHQPRDTDLRPFPPIPPIAMPDRGTYNLVLNVYAKSFALHQTIILDRVKKIVQRMHDLHAATNDDEYILDAYSYISILQVYQKYIYQCPTLEYQYLDELYTIMRQIHNEIERRKTLPPDLQEKLKASKRALDGNPSTANKKKDISIFFPMSMSWAYGIVVDALLKSQPLYRTIFMADDIVVAMTGRQNRINTLPDNGENTDGSNTSLPVPIFIPHEICVKCWPQHDTLMRVVEGWGRSGLPLATERIEHLMYVVVADAHYPRVFFLNETMETWCNSAWHFAPFVVENLLQRGLEKTTHVHNKPTGQTFAIAIRAWMKSNKREAPYRAELLFQHMLHLYEFKEDSWYRPKETHLRYVFTAWLNRTQTGETYDGIGGKGLYPAEHIEKFIFWVRDREWFRSFAEAIHSMAIRAWSKQKLPAASSSDPAVAPPNPVQHASLLWHSFADTFVPAGEQVPPYPCNWVLETCCIVQPTKALQIEAYDVAISTFQRCKHNARSYVLMVQVLRAQVKEMDDLHRSVIEDLFRRCCFAGLLTQEMVMHVVAITDNPETIQRLLGLSYQIAQLILQHQKNLESRGQKLSDERLPNALMVQNLPKEWSMNAKVSTPQPSPEPSKARGFQPQQQQY